MQTARVLFLGLGLLSVAACSEPTQTVEISLTQQDAGAWRLEYDLDQPVRRLDLGPSLNGFRLNDWRIETQELAIVSDSGRDLLVNEEKKAPFQTAAFGIHPHRNGFAKQYEPITRFADGGVIIYTGHFWPFDENGERLSESFTIEPRDGARIFAFGETGARLKQWKSPYDHPAFIYVGPLQSADLGAASAIVDAAAPGWVAEAVKAQTPALLEELAEAFGRDLAAAPDFFLLMDGEGEPGRLRYNGDALPGQVMVRLSGGAWAEPTPEARRLLFIATAHEAAHLWQMRARPSDGAVPAWIHEGGADALAAEIAARLGLKDGEGLAAVRDDCREALAGRSLEAAEAAGDWPASYACGRVIAEIAARAAADGDVAGFWRVFIDRAEAAGGYDEALFYSMLDEAGRDDLAAGLRRFAHTAFAAPDKELARLVEETGADRG